MIHNQSRIGFLLSLCKLIHAFGSVEVSARDFGTIELCSGWSIMDLILLIEGNQDIAIAE